jgi:hypothetical protein
MKLVAYTFLFFCIFLTVGCKKDNQPGPVPYTNKGNGMVDYNGTDTLAVKAYDSKNFLIQGNSIPKQSATVYVAISFPKGRPQAGYYTPVKDSINVTIVYDNTLYWNMRTTDTVVVTTSGNTLNASFKNATFDLLGYSVTNRYTGNLMSN